MSSVNGLPGLNVSPYLTSALSRMRASDLAAAPKGPAPAAAGGGASQILSPQTLGALVAIQSGSNSNDV